MSDRKYSLEEIDRIRAAIPWANPYERLSMPDIEAAVRTHMINGCEPMEIEKRAHEIFSKNAYSCPIIYGWGNKER